jgi:hypothetical protein
MGFMFLPFPEVAYEAFLVAHGRNSSLGSRKRLRRVVFEKALCPMAVNAGSERSPPPVPLGDTTSKRV